MQVEAKSHELVNFRIWMVWAPQEIDDVTLRTGKVQFIFVTIIALFQIPVMIFISSRGKKKKGKFWQECCTMFHTV